MRAPGIALGCLLGVTGLTAALLAPRGSREASADASRTAALGLEAFDFDDDGVAEEAITAQACSGVVGDACVRIDTYWSAPGQPEREGGSTWAERTDAEPLWARWRYPRDEFRSGTVLRAVFTTSGRDGTTSTQERRLTLP